MQIAILDDDRSLAEFVSICVSSSGHECKIFTTGKDFMQNAPRQNFDLHIIDWELPDINGDKVLEWLRKNYGFTTPVLFLTAHNSEEDLVKILQLGADDYVTKPVKPLELIARINALLRRSEYNTVKINVIDMQGIHFDLNAQTVSLNNELCNLTPKEYKLASYMFQKIGQLISRKELLENIWNTSSSLNTRTVDTHMSRIRKKLKLDKEHGWELQVVYQNGYRLESLTNHANNG